MFPYIHTWQTFWQVLLNRNLYFISVFCYYREIVIVNWWQFVRFSVTVSVTKSWDGPSDMFPEDRLGVFRPTQAAGEIDPEGRRVQPGCRRRRGITVTARAQSGLAAEFEVSHGPRWTQTFITIVKWCLVKWSPTWFTPSLTQVLVHYATLVGGGAVSSVRHWWGHQGGHHQGVVR